MTSILKGTGVAVITPFLENKNIDEAALKKILHHLIQGGVDFLVLLGTTSEAATLSREEKKRLLTLCYEEVQGKIPLIVGVGGNNLAALDQDIAELPLNPVAALMCVTPYYNKPSQQGLYEYYEYVSRKTDKKIILYNVPGRTGISLQCDTIVKIAKNCPNIIGIKEASTDLQHYMPLCFKAPADFSVVSGNDAFALSQIALGMQGLISVCANAYPRQVTQLIRAALANDFSKARTLQPFMMALDHLSFVENNPAGIKAVMSTLGLCRNVLRLPLVPLSAPYMEQVKTFTETFKP